MRGEDVAHDDGENKRRCEERSQVYKVIELEHEKKATGIRHCKESQSYKWSHETTVRWERYYTWNWIRDYEHDPSASED